MSTNDGVSRPSREQVETDLNALRAALAEEGKALGFIHRTDGRITLTIFAKKPGGTFYMGPRIDDRNNA